MKVSSQGRIEPHNAVYRLEPAAAVRIEFDMRNERLELELGKATSVAPAQELSVIRDQIANKKDQIAASSLVDEGAVREAVKKEGTLASRHRLGEQRARLGQDSPSLERLHAPLRSVERAVIGDRRHASDGRDILWQRYRLTPIRTSDPKPVGIVRCSLSQKFLNFLFAACFLLVL
ncbi:MAG TPA: hypothetical protein VF469_35615 [Kofleriaceae bacterium]